MKHAHVETIVDMSERRRPLDAACECPLCHEQLASMKAYARHVGRHQKDLALFALPRPDVDIDEDQNRIEEERETDSEYSDVGVEMTRFTATPNSSLIGPDLLTLLKLDSGRIGIFGRR